MIGFAFAAMISNEWDQFGIKMQDSNLLRAVDRHIGSALCNGISAVHSLLPKGARARNSQPQKILVIELFEMGAAIMLIPSLRYLKKKYPNAEIHCLTTSACLPVWKLIGELPLERIHTLDSRSSVSLIRSALVKLWKLRRTKFDLIIDYELFMRVPAVLSGLLRARERAGFHKYFLEGLNRGWHYDHRCHYSQNHHISKNYLALTKTASETPGDLPNFKGEIPFEEISIEPMIKADRPLIERRFGISKNTPYIIICPDVGRTLSMRNYPRDSFVSLIRSLVQKYPDRKVVFIGTSAERETTRYILERLGNADFAIDLCGKTSFEELIQVIAGSELIITNDNGPAHFAALTGTKTLTMFSTDSPTVYGPLGPALIAYSYYHCSPCISAYNHKTSRCSDNKCLQAISPARLSEFADLLLKGEAKLRTVNNLVPYV